MDKFLAPSMPAKTQRSRSERRPHEAKMAAAPSTEPGSSSTSAPGIPVGMSGKGTCPVSAPLPVAPAHVPSLLGGKTAADDMAPLSDPLISSGAHAPQAAEDPTTYSVVVKAVQDVMAPLMEAQAESLKRAIQDIKSQFHQLAQQVATNEHRIGETFQDVHDLKRSYDKLQKSHLQLSNKVDDLENRSRRCNLRIVGIPESVKSHKLSKFLQTTLPSILNIQDACSDMVIERAHRLGPLRQEADNRPRVVIFKTLSFLHKEALWQASRKMKDIRWNDARLFVFQDYSSEVSRARKEFSTLCSRLVKDNRKFALLFPARLRLYDGTSFKDFTTVADAEGYLAELSRAVESTSQNAHLQD